MEITAKNIKITPVQVLNHIRKNHAMEHATIHMLSRSMPKASFAGYSFVKGFWILGKAELQEVQKAAEMAHARLKNGEKQLAVHPNCGTNLATTGLCTAAAAMVTRLFESDDENGFSRFSNLMMAGIVGAFAGRKLGPEVQKNLTTDANVSDLSIVSITCSSLHGTPLFFVETALD